MSQKTRFYSKVNKHSIINKSDYLGYKGGLVEQIQASLIVRPVFTIINILVILITIGLFFSGFSFGALNLILALYVLRFASLNDTENTEFIAKASPVLEMLWPKKWKADFGDMFIGIEERTGRQLWKDSSDFLYHSYIIGASGSGKTVFLNSVFFLNYLCMGSGIFFLDFKGTTDLALQYLSTLQRFGRANCFKLLNFGNAQPIGSVKKNSHSNSSFQQNDPYPSFMFLDPFISPEGGGGETKYFVDNAIQHLMAVLQALHDMQKKRYFRITPSLIAKYAKLNEFLGLYHDDRVSDIVKNVYLVEIYDQFNLNYKEVNGEQGDDHVRMYGLFTGQYLPSLRFFGDNFGQIYESMVSEFDVISLVNNRQVGVASVPTASKGQSHIESLSMALLNQLRVALGHNLGGDFHGSRIDVANVTRKSDDVPYLFAADEYFVGLKSEGLGIQAAQGRGAGLALAAASQDTTALDHTNEREHGQILGSTQNKYLMCLKDVKNTMDLVEKLIPEEDVIKRSTSDSEWNNYTVNSKSTVETIKVERPQDLTDNILYPQGTMLAIGPGHACKIRCFYYDSEEFLMNRFRLSCSLPSVPPNETTLKREIELRDLSLLLEKATEVAHQSMRSRMSGESAKDVKALAFGLAGESWPFIITNAVDYIKPNTFSSNQPSENIENIFDAKMLAVHRLTDSASATIIKLFESGLTSDNQSSNHQDQLDIPNEKLEANISDADEFDGHFESTAEDSDGHFESTAEDSDGQLEIKTDSSNIDLLATIPESISQISQESSNTIKDSLDNDQTATFNSSVNKQDATFVNSLNQRVKLASEAATALASKKDLFIDAEIQLSHEAYQTAALKYGSNVDVWNNSKRDRGTDYELDEFIDELKLDKEELYDLVESVL